MPGALTRFGDQWGVFLVEGARARRRTITIGHRNEDVAEVLSGLRPGEIVIVHFVSAPQSPVLLRARPSPRATTGTIFRLSPFTTTWRARPGSGLLEFSTSERVVFLAGVVPGERTDGVVHAAVYRTAR